MENKIEKGKRTHVFVDGERRGRVLEEDVGHSHFERSQLRDLLAYLRGDEVATPGGGGHSDCSLRPPSCPRLNL